MLGIGYACKNAKKNQNINKIKKIKLVKNTLRFFLSSLIVAGEMGNEFVL